MTRDEIIRMAREAGYSIRQFDGVDEVMDGDNYHIQTDEVEKFAALIAAAEREACAEICDRFQARDVGMQPAECAGAIRARGNT